MLQRTLEPEVMDDRIEAECYDMMDHEAVNRAFVDDLLAAGPVGRDVCDLGTGTALIPIELCLRDAAVRVMAVDASVAMLELARYRVEVAGVRQRIQLSHAAIAELPFQDGYFDTEISNSLVHHLADVGPFFSACRRLPRAGGRVFVRDLLRPATDAAVEDLVRIHCDHEPPAARQLFRQSLHAALTLEEVAAAIQAAALPTGNLAASSDRHWTWHYRLDG